MSSSTCHLSSLKINTGDEVVLIPVAYSEISETSETVYSSSPSASPIGLPLFGTYESFGRVTLNERSQGGAEVLCNKFKENFMNDPVVSSRIKNSRYHFGAEFYVFSHKDSPSTPERGEFISDSDARRLAKEEGRLTQDLDLDLGDADTLLSLLQMGAIFDLSDERRVRRFGRLLLRKDIYQKMIEGCATKFKEKVEKNLSDLMGIEVIEKRNIGFAVSKEAVTQRILLLGDNHDSVTCSMMARIHSAILDKEGDHTWLVRELTEYSLVMYLYASLGKSFYPNAMNHGTMMPIYLLNGIVNDYIDSKRQANVEEFGKDVEWIDH